MEGSQGVLHGFGRIQADPEGVHLLEFLVVGMLENNPFLAGNEPGAVIGSPLFVYKLKNSSMQCLFFQPRAQILGHSGRGFHGITIFL